MSENRDHDEGKMRDTNDPYGWERFRLNVPESQQEKVPTASASVDEKETRRKQPKKHRMRIVAAILCISLFSGIAGSTATYFLMRSNTETLVNQAVNRVVNSISLKPTTSGTSASLKTSNFSDVIEQASEGVVAITAQGQGMSIYGSTATSAGSGVIIRADGIIVTCAHVVESSKNIKVYLKNGQEYDAQVVGSDEKSDIAVLKISATNLSPVSLGDSSQLRLGDNVIAIGNPLGELNGSVTVGVISAVERSIVIGNYTMTVLQTDAAINPGNSGGALLNSQGQLIGIVNAKSSGTSVEGLGFAIPLNKITSVIEQLLTYGYVKDRPYIGISMQEITSTRMGDTPGVYVVQVYSNSAAEKAGLMIGDRIVSIDDKTIKSISDIDAFIDSSHVGQVIKMVIERDKKQSTVQLTLTDSSNRNN